METELGSIVPLQWRSSFVKARTALCHDDIAAARPLFDEIAEALPANMEVRLYAAWARARLAESMSDGEHDALERLARETLGTRQSLALPLCILAHAAVRRGELRVAKRLFRRAADTDPALVDAQRGVRMVDQRLPRMIAGRARGSGPWFAYPERFVLAIFAVLMSVAAALAKTVS